MNYGKFNCSVIVCFLFQGNDSDTDILLILWPNKSSSTSLDTPEAMPFFTISNIPVVSGRFQHIYLVIKTLMDCFFWSDTINLG